DRARPLDDGPHPARLRGAGHRVVLRVLRRPSAGAHELQRADRAAAADPGSVAAHRSCRQRDRAAFARRPMARRRRRRRRLRCALRAPPLSAAPAARGARRAAGPRRQGLARRRRRTAASRDAARHRCDRRREGDVRVDDGVAHAARRARGLARAGAGSRARGPPLPRRSARRLDDARPGRCRAGAAEARPRPAARCIVGLGPARTLTTMNAAVPAYDLAPLAGIVAVGTLIALVPLAWSWRRRQGDAPALRLQAFAWLVLFLAFDLVLLGAYTRLSDSGLGCPDWPGCYGHASPIGAGTHIAAAEAAIPTGPVTVSKAWVEMLHRYAATAIGVLVIVLLAMALREARRSDGRIGARWALLTLVWICMQGAFGALAVTMRLYPAIVTLHLLAGYGLLALLAVQAEHYAPRPLALAPALRRGVLVVALLTVAQAA